jgi:hypothetical protein
LDRRVELGEVPGRIQVGVEQVHVEVAEAAPAPAFLVEQLSDRHPRQVLGEEGVQARQARAHRAVGAARPRPEPFGHPIHERQDSERRERQPPVHPQHHGGDADQRGDVAEDRDDARGDQLVQRIDVVCDPRDEPTDRLTGEEGRGERLEVVEHLAAQVGHDALADVLHQVALQPPRGEADAEDRDVQRGDAGEPARIRRLPERAGVGRDVPVDRDAVQPGARQIGRGRNQQEPDRPRHDDAVRAHVPQQPADQVRVVCAAENLVFFEHGAHGRGASAPSASAASSSSRRSCCS